MAGLRTRTMGLNAENANVGAPKTTKQGLAHTRGRTALNDIGNKKITVIATGPSKPPVAVKPARGLTRQKASTTLKPTEDNVRVTRSRSSLESKMQQMDVDEHDAMEVDQGVREAVISEPIEDIDKEDSSNPQLAAEYVNEIYGYLMYLEEKQAIKKEYLPRNGTILPKMRAVLVDWLVEVHQQFSLLQETLYLTIAIIDRFLESKAVDINRKHLQLVGVAAMFIASKYEEMYAPEIGDFVYITDNAYTQAQILKMEYQILHTLTFDLGRPLPLHFLRRNSKAGQVDAQMHTLAKYVMELSLPEYSLCHVAPSKMAAAALALSLKVLEPSSKPLASIWTPTLVHYSKYTLTDLRSIITELAGVLKKVTESPVDAKMMAIKKKYTHKKFMKISALKQLSEPVLEELAEGNF